jgi:hypothetical protein
MYRILTYGEGNLLRDVRFIESDNLTYSQLNEAFNTNVKSLIEFFYVMDKNGLSVIIDTNWDKAPMTKEEYIGSYTMEIDVIVNNITTPDTTYRIPFTDLDLNQILSVPEIVKIMEVDEKFSKLMNQVEVLDADWDAIFNYLSRVYGITKVQVNYYSNPEDNE